PPRLQPRNRPPRAVRTNRPNSPRSPERKHCASAECSESTRINCPGLTLSITMDPPATSDSLLASARISPASIVASVASKPMEPTRALRTVSASTSRTSWAAESRTTPPRASETSFAACGCATATCSAGTLKLRACSTIMEGFEPPAAMPTTSNFSGFALTTSSAAVPMEPDEPRIKVRFSHPTLVNLKNYSGVDYHNCMVDGLRLVGELWL